MPATTFAERTRDPAVYRLLRKATLVVVAVWIPLAAWSGFRAIVQVFRLDLVAPPVASAGGEITANVVISGRAHVDLTLELVQGSRTVVVGHRFVRGNRDGALDPRPRRDALTVRLTEEQLAGWTSEPLFIRATAVGRSQWMRTPPPTVREVALPR